MKILITGSNGFIGKNLKYFLIENKYKILEQNRNDNIKKLITNLYECDLIIHLAGENRPKVKNLFKINNENFTENILIHRVAPLGQNRHHTHQGCNHHR